MKKLKICPACRKYTMSDTCACGGDTRTAHPPKYSPQDRYAKYRRQFEYGMRE
ncbi:MAG: RNA-protein complex protein Nop10 [Candidatus Micrarchaeota archaeon]